MSDAPLATVAARFGFGSEFAFAKAFKRKYGMGSPSLTAEGMRAYVAVESDGAGAVTPPAAPRLVRDL